MNPAIYQFFMRIGRATGCHQMPERSFFVRGYQFPVCARCTGVFLGQIIGMIAGNLLLLSKDWITFLWFIMFFDWYLQRMKLLSSTNLRRFVTGSLCGYGLGQAYFKVILYFMG